MTISAAQIRAARGLLGWSQTVLAETAEVSRSAVARLELGETETREATLDAIHQALVGAGVMFFQQPETGLEGVQRIIPSSRSRQPKQFAKRHGS
jgi:transcriptional regulator with XRE-family HTH domain